MSELSEHQSGQSRRDLLKKAAVGGAIAWGTPMLLSSPAFAATKLCGTGSTVCTTRYGVSYGTTNGLTGPTANAGGAQCGGPEDADIYCFSGNPPVRVPGQTNVVSGIGQVTFAVSASGLEYSFTLNAGCLPIVMYAHFGGGGDNCWKYLYTPGVGWGPGIRRSGSGTCGLNTVTTIGNTTTLRNVECGLSGVSFYFCC